MWMGFPYWVCGSLLGSKDIGEGCAVCTIHAKIPRILRLKTTGTEVLKMDALKP